MGDKRSKASLFAVPAHEIPTAMHAPQRTFDYQECKRNIDYGCNDGDVWKKVIGRHADKEEIDKQIDRGND